MRTIEEIKESITADFMRNEDLAKAYGFEVGSSFTEPFTKTSIESILFYIFATAGWVLENLFAEYKKDVGQCIENIIPHRPKWYCHKVLNFMKDKILIEDTDQYNTAGMMEDEIKALQVVKHAVATERKDSSVLTIKVAGLEGKKRCKLPAEVEKQLSRYITEIKDAGVRINLVNMNADIFNCEVDIYYNAMLLPENVKAECHAVIVENIENLPFNGEYTNMSLVDVLQKIEGVEIVEFKNASTRVDGASVELPINARCVPDAGYFAAGTFNINMIVYE